MTTFQVEKMNCNGCAGHVAEAMRAVCPEAEVKVDLAAKRVEVSPEVGDPQRVAKAVTDAGYPAQVAG